MFADEAEEVEVLLGRLLGELFEHFGFGLGAEDEANLLIPSSVDVVQLAGAFVDEFLENAALLLHAGDGKMRAFEGIQDAKKMLAFAKDDLRGASNAAIFLFFVLHKIRTSHDLMLPIGLWRLAKRHIIPNRLMWLAHVPAAALLGGLYRSNSIGQETFAPMRRSLPGHSSKYPKQVGTALVGLCSGVRVG